MVVQSEVIAKKMDEWKVVRSLPDGPGIPAAEVIDVYRIQGPHSITRLPTPPRKRYAQVAVLKAPLPMTRTVYVSSNEVVSHVMTPPQRCLAVPSVPWFAMRRSWQHRSRAKEPRQAWGLQRTNLAKLCSKSVVVILMRMALHERMTRRRRMRSRSLGMPRVHLAVKGPREDVLPLLPCPESPCDVPFRKMPTAFYQGFCQRYRIHTAHSWAGLDISLGSREGQATPGAVVAVENSSVL